MVIRLFTQDVAHIKLLQQLDVRAVQGQAIRYYQQFQMRMLTPYLRQQPLRRIALAVVLFRPVCLHDRFRWQGNNLLALWVNQYGTQHLMIVGDTTTPVILLAAVIAVYRLRGEIPRPIHGQQVLPRPAELLQSLAPLLCSKQLLERAP